MFKHLKIILNSIYYKDKDKDTDKDKYIILPYDIYPEYHEIFYPGSFTYNNWILCINSLDNFIIILKRLVQVWKNNYNIIKLTNNIIILNDKFLYYNAIVYLQTKCNINYNMTNNDINYGNNNHGYIGINTTLYSICDNIDILYR